MAMNANPPSTRYERNFQVWEYQVSHGQLLVRSPQGPATDRAPAQTTNIDLVFVGVEFFQLPRALRGLAIERSTLEERTVLASSVGRTVEPERAWTLVSESRRYFVVAASLTVSENNWDIFDSPFEFRSHFRREG